MTTAFFFLSKIAWFLLQPLHSLIFLLLGWQGARLAGRRRLGSVFLACLLIYAGVVFATPLPELALRSLENRFPPQLPPAEDFAGIIVLGGATDSGAVSRARGQVTLNGAAERLTTAIVLHRAMPEKEIIVSGYSGRLVPRGWNEAEITRRFLAEQGVDPARIRFEAQSRNTAENAERTAALLGAPRRPWLLVTSAAHMPRAVGAFRSVGMPILAYPVDFRTEPDNLIWPRSLAGSLGDAGSALHEWMGLLAYYLTGRSSALFPAPYR